MKKSIAAITLVLPFVACGNPTTAGAPDASTVSTIDDSLAEAETGRDPAGSRAHLEAILADSTQSADDRGRVALALSRLAEASGDHERAVTLAEQAVALNTDAADARLFSLLTGKEQPSGAGRRLIPQRIPSSARAFAKYWSAATPDHPTEIEIDSFGGLDSWEGGPSSVFDVGAALRDKAVDACGYCDDPKVKIHTHSSREGFWTAIPRYQGKLDHALVVVYVDAQTIPPPRYAQWLAVGTAAIEDAFSRGDGLVAVKERPSAPPLVTIAAPRFTQLEQVETALAAMATLPFTPSTITLHERLAPYEIRTTVRSRLPVLRGCYQSLLGRNASAAGTLEASFTVASDGSTRGIQVQIPQTLEEPTFRTCVESALQAMQFPAWSRDAKATTTVKYPINLTP